MSQTGKLEKMLILAFSDSQKAESGGIPESSAHIYALINPESYNIDYKIKFSDTDQAQGTSSKQLKYVCTEPAELTFEFLFDNTGIIDGNPRDSVADDIKTFKEIVIDYKGDSHEPHHYKLVWGENSIFKGRVSEASITYKLFKPDGTPIRAVAKVKFVASVEEEKRVAKDANQSSDLTHVRTVKAGDTLPLMCTKIYGDPRFYLQVAAKNQLTNFRVLTPGTEIMFPPVDKTPKAT